MSGLLNIQTLVDNEEKGNVECVITRNDGSVEYSLVSDDTGYASILLDDGEWIVKSTYLNDIFNYNPNEVSIVIDNAPYGLSINFWNCNNSENEVLLDKTCKYFYHEPYMTPNNYDLYFDYRAIPVNIKTESPLELHRRLSRYLPLTKILHLNLDNHSEEISNTVHISNNLNLNYESYTITRENNSYIPNIVLVWNDTLLTELLYTNLNKVLLNDLEIVLSGMGLSNQLSSDDLDNLVSIIDNENSDNLNLIDKTIIVDDEEVIIKYNIGLYNSLMNLINQSIGTITDSLLISISDYYLSNNLTEEEYAEYEEDAFLVEGERILDEQVSDFINREYNNFNNSSIDDYKHQLTCNVYSINKTIKDDITYHYGILNMDEILFNSDEGGGLVKGEYDNGSFQLVSDGVFVNGDVLSDTVYVQGLLDVIIDTQYSDSNLVGFNILLNSDNNWSNSVNNSLKIFPVLPDGSLDYTRINYSLTYSPMYKIYTCKDCGYQMYSDSIVDGCSECDGNSGFEVSVPYTIMFNNDIIDYIEKRSIKLI